MNLMNRIDEQQSLSKILNPSSTFLTFGNDANMIEDRHMSDEDEDESQFMEDENNQTCKKSKGRKVNSSSQWQRMKWTDSRVRLLIQVVAYVGDDDVDGGGSSRKLKGKWKTVSKMMVSKGCMVSPQQCEDKFNDLNKRYKRLNDILGRGICCRVVENPSLMETIPRLTSKMKDDVKKILNSKHLFYAEMCAYHNGQVIPNCGELDLLQQACEAPVPVPHAPAVTDHENHSDEDNDDGLDDDEDDDDGLNLVTRCDSFRDEMNEFFENVNNTNVQKKEWVKNRMLQLVEQRVGIESDGFEMEKRRFKWQRFCDRKDRELEISRLEKERMMLEKERMVLRLKLTNQIVDSG